METTIAAFKISPLLRIFLTTTMEIPHNLILKRNLALISNPNRGRFRQLLKLIAFKQIIHHLLKMMPLLAHQKREAKASKQNK